MFSDKLSSSLINQAGLGNAQHLGTSMAWFSVHVLCLDIHRKVKWFGLSLSIVVNDAGLLLFLSGCLHSTRQVADILCHFFYTDWRTEIGELICPCLCDLCVPTANSCFSAAPAGNKVCQQPIEIRDRYGWCGAILFGRRRWLPSDSTYSCKKSDSVGVKPKHAGGVAVCIFSSCSGRTTDARGLRSAFRILSCADSHWQLCGERQRFEGW